MRKHEADEPGAELMCVIFGVSAAGRGYSAAAGSGPEWRAPVRSASPISRLSCDYYVGANLELLQEIGVLAESR